MSSPSPPPPPAPDKSSTWPGRWAAIDALLARPSTSDPHTTSSSSPPPTSSAGPEGEPEADPEAVQTFLRTAVRVLVVGAGGLGCEMLQTLALVGIGQIDVLDMDTIELSNLNRQFLFRPSDLGQSKAVVAARFVQARVPGCTVTPHHCRLQDKPPEFFRSFHIILAGLDSVEARRWLNATVHALVDPDVPESLVPLIDGGTEGFLGQTRVVLPSLSSCYDCSLDLLPPRTTYPLCTIASTPRLPEHCVEWASVLEWPRVYPDTVLDPDDPEHVQWLFDTAAARAKRFAIEGVTWALAQGVVKRIIPAIASTNAIIAGACVNEALKIATSTAPPLNNYMMYSGAAGVYTYTFEHERKKDCPVCGHAPTTLSVDPDWTLRDLLEHLAESSAQYVSLDPCLFSNLAAEWIQSQVKKASLSSRAAGSLYYQAPAHLERKTRQNLDKKLSELLKNGDDLMVTAAALPFGLNMILKFEAKTKTI